MKQHDKLIEELFDSISLIAKKSLKEEDFSGTVIGKISERVALSDSYIVNYQGVEMLASSMGQTYSLGDEVIILVPGKDLNSQKFILGRTNTRTPTIQIDESGKLSDLNIEYLQEVMDEINSILSDGKVTPKEKEQLAMNWDRIKADHGEVVDASKDYPVVDLENLMVYYKDIEKLMNKVLSDMDSTTEEDLEELRESMSKYTVENRKVKNEILEEIKKEVVYRVDVLSTNGESFKNGIISTELRAIVYRGRKDVTVTLPQSAFIWHKLDDQGEPISGWSHIGQSVTVTGDDVDVKQIYRCQIKIEEAIVASDLITLVDLNDGESLEILVRGSLPSSQTYNQNSGKFNPDWSFKNPVFTATATINGDEATKDTRFRWFLDGIEILKTDKRFSISSTGDKITIKENIMNQGDNVYSLTCEGTYNNRMGIVLKNIETVDLSLTMDGLDGSPALQISLEHPDGTILRDDVLDMDQLRISAIVHMGDKEVTDKLKDIKWFIRNPSIGPGDPNYDIDGGKGWALISEKNTIGGAVADYNTPNLIVGEGAVEVSTTFKIFVRFADNAVSATTTLIDMEDPIQVVIEGNGIFKHGEYNDFIARVFIGRRELGTEEIEEKFLFVWNLSKTAKATMRTGDAGWPKVGRQITVRDDEIPDGVGNAIVCEIVSK